MLSSMKSVYRASLQLVQSTGPSTARKPRCFVLPPFDMTSTQDAVTVTATGSRLGYGDTLQEYQNTWEEQWTAGVDPGTNWDARRSAPALHKLLEANPTIVSGKTVVVPGCGRGYDIVTFSQYALKTVGVEISETAAQSAREYVKTQEDAAGKDVSVIVADWLSKDGLKEQFDVGYDYTFFCALHPDMREGWADGWARSIKPGGHLIALCFPIEPPGRPGPPWPLQLSDNEKVLKPRGFNCITAETVPEEEATCSERAGKEILTVWVKGADGAKI